jgi:hypothetical protein
MKTNNEKIGLSLNPNTRHKNQNKSQKVKENNMKCANKSANKSFL